MLCCVVVPSLLGTFRRTLLHRNGQTPLHWAATYGHADVVRLLVKLNAHIDAEDNYGYSWVFRCCGQTCARPALTGACGRCTALHNAVIYGQSAAVSSLLASKASFEANAKTGYVTDCSSCPQTMHGWRSRCVCAAGLRRCTLRRGKAVPT